MVLFRHPSRRALREWLDRDPSIDERSAIDDHLDTCRRCTTILERMVEDDGGDTTGSSLSLAADESERPTGQTAGTAPSIGDALAQLYAPPVDLAERLERRVVARLDSRVVIDVVTDLFGAGVEASKLLFVEDPHNE
jgi:hypothetical protein